MADQLYLENIDEFVTDQNKIVRSWAWGTRAGVRLGSWAQEGGGVLNPCACGLVGGGTGQRQVPKPGAPRRARARGRGAVARPQVLAPRGSRRAPRTAQGPRREGRWWLMFISKASPRLSGKMGGV